MVSGDPIVTSSGDYVRLTWTWVASSSGLQNIQIDASIQIQAGTPVLSGSALFEIETVDDGNEGGGGFYQTKSHYGLMEEVTSNCKYQHGVGYDR